MGRDDTIVRGFPLAYARTQRFSLGAPRSLAVVDNGSMVAFLRSADGSSPSLSLWVLDLSSGSERLVVNPTELAEAQAEDTPEERARRERAREAAGGIVRFETASAKPWATFVLGGSIYIASLNTGEVRRVASATPAFDAHLSPSGAHIAYVHGGSLRVLTLGSSSAEDVDRALSPAESSPTISWGQAEFVAAEEMDRTRGFWWSPDSTQIIAARVDVDGVREWHIGDPANPATPPTAIRYPAAGTANASVTLHLLNISLSSNSETDSQEGTTQTIDWQSDSTGVNDVGYFEYLADISWTSDAALLVRQTRDQRTTSICSMNLVADKSESTIAVSELRRIVDGHWTELHPGSPRVFEGSLFTIEDLPDRRALCRDGVPVTEPGMNVHSLVSIDAQGLTITASLKDPSEVHGFRIPADGWAPTALTTSPGVHAITEAKGLRIIAAATPDHPVTQFSVHRLEGSEAGAETDIVTIRNLSEDPFLRSKPIFLTLGKRELSAALFLPSDHDGRTALPVLLDPYGGPGIQRVLKFHNPHLVSRWFAEQGYAVLVTDGRGTPGRGPAFEREVWGDLADPILTDQIDALDAAAEAYPFMDLNRVGIRGWSFGGYLAALAVLRQPERIHAAIAGAPVTDWALYDTHYTERYLGDPAEHPANYKRSSLMPDAGDLTRPLLLIHGLADDNVVAAHTLRLSSAMLAEGRSHRVLPLSGVTHMTPQAVVAQNLLLLQRDFLDEILRPAALAS